jgi:hypothetical protein
MDISRECMCENNNPECVECWYAMPGYSVTETKRRLPLQKERTHLTYDEEFEAFEAEGICYEVVGPRADADGGFDRTAALSDPCNQEGGCSDQNCEPCYQKDLRSVHSDGSEKYTVDTSSNGSNKDAPYWHDADTARLRWNALQGQAKPEEAHAWTAFEEDLADIFGECIHLMVAKHNDYGPDSINSAPGGPLNGLRVRLHDKLARINHLIDTGTDPQNESLRDSFVDLANYSVIGLMVIDGTWPGTEGS